MLRIFRCCIVVDILVVTCYFLLSHTISWQMNIVILRNLLLIKGSSLRPLRKRRTRRIEEVRTLSKKAHQQ